jgi:lipase maturation factor 1
MTQVTNVQNAHHFRLVSSLFVRLLGLIYLVAFGSLSTQIEGLVGSSGILPIASELQRQATGNMLENVIHLPTLFWLNASDQALLGATVAGCLVSLLIVLQRWLRSSLVFAFVLYLSLYNVCQPFMHFQWDGLLLEAGFLALWLTPDSRAVVWLFRWLLFRLRFESGVSKLFSGDSAWPDLTALRTYFEVQPLPGPFAWFAHQLPDWLLRLGTGATLFVEILVPLMMFLPRPWRFAAAWLTILWQVLIILTSNHNWFNLLTIALCLFLFDDRALYRVIPEELVRLLSWRPTQPLWSAAIGKRAGGVAVALLTVLVIVISAAQLRMLVTRVMPGGAIGALVGAMEQYRIVNLYHVFPTMTRQRIELEILGSVDGEKWKAYRFRYKPGDPSHAPEMIVPFQPRLDWEMWFVPLHPRYLPWFEQFLYALLDNSPSVTGLLEFNPFADAPPNMLRVEQYRYTFTSRETRNQTGNWWHREYEGAFEPLPGVARDDDGS